jgi:histidinol dehydrogenase
MKGAPAMDLREYAASLCRNAGAVGRAELEKVRGELASRGLTHSGIATVKPYRQGFDACRVDITAALDRLTAARTMTEAELRELDEAMRDEIPKAHAAVARDDQLSTTAQGLRSNSEDVTIQKLAVAVAAGRDKLRLERESRDFQWKLALVGALLGFLLGIASTLLLQAIT